MFKNFKNFYNNFKIKYFRFINSEEIIKIPLFINYKFSVKLDNAK